MSNGKRKPQEIFHLIANRRREERLENAFGLITSLERVRLATSKSDVRVWAAVVIQKNWRSYCDRQKYLKTLNDEFFNSENKRVLVLEEQIKELQKDIENDRLLTELDNLDFVFKNIERKRRFSAIAIQRFWRKYKRKR